MAVRFTDGFDLYTQPSDMDDTRQWFIEDSAGLLSISTTGGKYGGGALVLADGSSDSVFNTFATGLSSPNTMCGGFLFKTAAATTPSGTAAFMGIGSATDDSTGGNVTASGSGSAPSLVILSTGRVAFYVSGLTTDEFITVDINVCDGLWHWIEFASRIDGTTGILRLNVDGTASLQDITSGDATGTVPLTNKAQDRIIITTGGNQDTSYYIDDLILYDDVSSGIAGDLTYTSNYPIGEVRIETLQPSGAGTNSDWTPLSGANYTNVDENVADDDTTYISSATATDLDTYAFGNLAGTPSTILGVHVSSVGRAEPGSTTDVRHYTLSNGTADESADIELNPAYQFNQSWVGQDPDTSTAWIAAGVNAAEFGFEKQ